MLKDNPKYRKVISSNGVDFYAPAADTDYHMSRYVAAGAQNQYSQAGITKELLSTIIEAGLDICNEEKADKRLRTNLGVLLNNLKYRMKYPIDEDCAIRMGAIYTFMEGENPDIVDHVQTEKKVLMAKADPELYAFFLSIGVQSTPSWSEYAPPSLTEYFNKRKNDLKTLEIL